MPSNLTLTVSTGLLLAVVLLLFFLGCLSTEKNQLDVKVYDLITGNPIEGATVEIYSSDSLVKTGTTGQGGIASIDLTGLQTTTQQGSQNSFTVDAYADSYPPETKTAVDLSQSTSLTFQLEQKKAVPIPAGRYYEDAVISDSLPDLSAGNGNTMALILYKVVVNDSLQAESALFRLQSFGNTIMTKEAYAGNDLRSIMVDDNGNKVLASSVMVKSIGYDSVRQMGYTDITFAK